MTTTYLPVNTFRSHQAWITPALLSAFTHMPSIDWAICGHEQNMPQAVYALLHEGLELHDQSQWTCNDIAGVFMSLPQQITT